MNTHLKLKLVAMTATVFAISSPVLAEQVSDDAIPQIHIITAGIDLRSPEGVRQLKARARREAETVCHLDDGNRYMFHSGERECYDTVVLKANAQIDALAANTGSSKTQSMADAGTNFSSTVKTAH